MKRRLIIGLLIGCVLALLVYWLASSPLDVEVSEAGRGSVYEFISEDGKTRLSEKYTISMPIDGRLLRMDLEIGDYVERGEVVARIDPYQIQQRLAGLSAQLEEISAQMIGVDETKTKQEDIDAAYLRVEASRLKLKNAERDLDIARIDFEKQKKDFLRIQELRKDDAVAQSAYDGVEQGYESAQERLHQAGIQKMIAEKEMDINETFYRRALDSVDDNEYLRKAYIAQEERIVSEINILKDHLQRVEIRSPVGGPIIEKIVEDEQVLLSGAPVLVIGDLSSVEIESDILSEEIGRVKIGQKVEVSGKALGKEIVTGHVKRVYPSGFKKISSLGIEQQRVRVLISFDNDELGLRPEVSVDIKIIVAESHDTLRIPEKAIFRYRGRWAVFCLDKNRAVINRIEVGLRNTDYVEVTKGLNEGQAFVLMPTNELKPGMKVRPVR